MFTLVDTTRRLAWRGSRMKVEPLDWDRQGPERGTVRATDWEPEGATGGHALPHLSRSMPRKFRSV
ncbi:hypothetical protein AGR7B_Cc210028 [Agrobacterium deltaense RV3]|nr:hypothetical protein AGR7B_Cc210028 [Agrobacterium deltaense RV3]